MTLKNERYKDSKLVTSFGTIEFDSEGVLKTELKPSELQELSELRGFTKVEPVKVKEDPVKSKEAPAKKVEKAEKKSTK